MLARGLGRVAVGLSDLAGSGPERGLRRPSWLGQWSIPPLNVLPTGFPVQLRSVKPAGSVKSHERRTGQAGHGQPEVPRTRG